MPLKIAVFFVSFLEVLSCAMQSHVFVSVALNFAQILTNYSFQCLDNVLHVY